MKSRSGDFIPDNMFCRRETIELKKIIKWIIGLGTAGTALGLLAVRLIKKSKNQSSDAVDNITEANTEKSESDDFDLDQDLEPAQERSYVSLHTSVQQEEDSENTESSEDGNEAVSEDI